jgi:hypothetical protein
MTLKVTYGIFGKYGIPVRCVVETTYNVPRMGWKVMHILARQRPIIYILAQRNTPPKFKFQVQDVSGMPKNSFDVI